MRSGEGYRRVGLRRSNTSPRSYARTQCARRRPRRSPPRPAPSQQSRPTGARGHSRSAREAQARLRREARFARANPPTRWWSRSGCSAPASTARERRCASARVRAASASTPAVCTRRSRTSRWCTRRRRVASRRPSPSPPLGSQKRVRHWTGRRRAAVARRAAGGRARPRPRGRRPVCLRRRRPRRVTWALVRSRRAPPLEQRPPAPQLASLRRRPEPRRRTHRRRRGSRGRRPPTTPRAPRSSSRALRRRQTAAVAARAASRASVPVCRASAAPRVAGRSGTGACASS
mmetsp:Transcript_8531/g.26364  ORF Transcript_8531/g.26364 Transcript_8531/m.26364 type:complete len:289 (+) Transcript_8531:1693-2559(+)